MFGSPETRNFEETDEVRIQAVLERARTGDRTALPELRQILDDRPWIWNQYGDLASHARNAWIGLIAAQNLTLQESLNRQAEAMKQELAGTKPSALEMLLVERIVTCWLQMAFADHTAARTDEISLSQAKEIRRRQDSAHRRYLSAVGSLAMTRRLLAPTLDKTSKSAMAASFTTRSAEVISVVGRNLGPIVSEDSGVAGDPFEENLVMNFVPPRNESLGKKIRRP